MLNLILGVIVLGLFDGMYDFVKDKDKLLTSFIRFIMISLVFIIILHGRISNNINEYLLTIILSAIYMFNYHVSRQIVKLFNS